MSASVPSDEVLIASVADELPFGVWVARAPGGELVYANREFARILGMGARDDVALGEYAAPYGIHDRTGNLYPEQRMPFVRALTERTEVVVDDLVIHRPDGGRAYVRATARPFFDSEQQITHVVIAFIDISREVQAELARQESEARARHAERMESIGNLASGVAHDFNNLLMVVKAMVDSMSSKAPAVFARDLKIIDEATQSAASLTRALLSFAGRGRAADGAVDLSATVRRVAELVRIGIDRRVELRVDAERPAVVHGDESELEQMVLNLAINGAEAMAEGGRLDITTSVEDGQAVLEVTDTGPGIPVPLRQRVFEPYFTTKTAGPRRGTGLGLATVHGIVMRHEGTIALLDNTPQGTRFRVAFRAASEAPPESPPVPDAQPGAGRVLVVDDEPMVLSAMSRVLHTLGYETVLAGGGEEAISVYRAQKATLRGVLMDIGMPGMGGVNAVKALREIDPDVRVVLMSGQPISEAAQPLLKKGVLAFLPKPWSRSALSQVLAEVLQKP